jgi:hypothetical protein
MTERRQRAHATERDVSVWIDHDQAVIRKGGVEDQDDIEHLERSPAESEPAFDLRTIHEIIDRDRVAVSGPAIARIGFERAYVSMTHRPDRLVAAEPTTPTSRHDGGPV